MPYPPKIDMDEAGSRVVADTATCKLQRGVMQLREGQFTTADARVKLKRLFPSL
jgi:hypothetical protein